MELTTTDILKQKILDAQENVRDYQEYSQKVEYKEVEETFKRFAEESGFQAQRLRELLNKYES